MYGLICRNYFLGHVTGSGPNEIRQISNYCNSLKLADRPLVTIEVE